MEVRPKKALGQHFLTDLDIAERIVHALRGETVLEVGPGTGVLTRILLDRTAPGQDGNAAAPGQQETPAAFGHGPDNGRRTVTQMDSDGHGGRIRSFKAIEIDRESAAYLRKNLSGIAPGLIEGDFLKLRLDELFPSSFSVIGNFPYNISSQIFFKILDYKDLIPEVVCMVQKEVAQRIAEKPGTKTYGILSVFLQAWYDIEYLFTVEPSAEGPVGRHPPDTQRKDLPGMRRETVQDNRQDSIRPAPQDLAEFPEAPVRQQDRGCRDCRGYRSGQECRDYRGCRGTNHPIGRDTTVRPRLRPSPRKAVGRRLRQTYIDASATVRERPGGPQAEGYLNRLRSIEQARASCMGYIRKAGLSWVSSRWSLMKSQIRRA